MKKIIAIAMMVAGVSLAAHAQRLIYEWNFTNSDGIVGTPTNMPAAYVGTNQLSQSLAGSGSLNIINIYGTGAGVNAYFTNGPGVGPGIIGVADPARPWLGSATTAGAYLTSGQGYNGGAPAAEAQGTNLNLGTMYRYTMTFWFQLGPSVGNRFPRIVMLGNATNYDEATAGVYGFASSLNSWTTSVTPNVAKSMQNDLSGTAQANGVTANLPANFTNSTGVNGIVCDATTWYFCAEEYNGSTNVGQWSTWLGTSATNVVKIDSQNLAFLGIPFGTNAAVQIGGSYSGKRQITDGQIADVRFWAGNLNSNNLEAVRTLILTNFVDDHSGDPAAAPIINSQPSGGNTFVGGSRTFAVDVTGLAPLAYQWKSNGVPIVGATNGTTTGSSLTLSNLQLSANNALITCTITNGIASTNTTAATLQVFAATPGSYDNAVLTNHPYIYWLLNENTNVSGLPVTIYDYVNGQDGSAAYPAYTTFQVPGLDSPLYPGFSTTNAGTETHSGGNPTDLNMVNLTTFTNGMTISGWILCASVPTSKGIIYDMVNNNDGGGTAGDGFGLWFNGIGTDVNGNTGGQLSYNWNPTGINPSPFASGLIVPTNEWTFIALTIDPTGEFATLYKASPGTGFQSSLDDTNITGDVIGSSSNFPWTLVLGRSSYGYWSGTGYGANNIAFSDVAIFYTNLPASTITNLYVAGAGVPLPRLTVSTDPNIPGYLILTWNFGTLQEATSVQGPYTDVAGSPTATYPDYVPTTDVQHYYRVRN